jgi:sporulation protein YlmC with PRC-barrel domain
VIKSKNFIKKTLFFLKKLESAKNMKISDELIGKDIIDESGDQVGLVKDVEWDFETNTVKSIILKEAGISAKIGLGDKKIVPYEMIEVIGDKVLIKGRVFKTE